MSRCGTLGRCETSKLFCIESVWKDDLLNEISMAKSKQNIYIFFFQRIYSLFTKQILI